MIEKFGGITLERPRTDLVCLALVFLTTGFVRAPFPQWTLGKVIEIHPEQSTLIIREGTSGKELSLHWDAKTLFWIQPTKRNDKGVIFDSRDVDVGVPVRVMFKKYSDEATPEVIKAGKHSKR